MPRKNNINSKQGFTIIEVVLVLAVAGLIFLMVFIALPSLQRTQRDTQRRQDLSRLSAAVVQYQTNNSSKPNNLPNPSGKCEVGDNINLSTYTSNTACNFIKQYLNSATATENLFLDPDGNPYQLAITDNMVTIDSPAPIAIGTGDDAPNMSYENGVYTFNINNAGFEAHAVFLVPGGKCGAEENQVVEAQRRHYAVIMKLEGSGFACLDNQ